MVSAILDHFKEALIDWVHMLVYASTLGSGVHESRVKIFNWGQGTLASSD